MTLQTVGAARQPGSGLPAADGRCDVRQRSAILDPGHRSCLFGGRPTQWLELAAGGDKFSDASQSTLMAGVNIGKVRHRSARTEPDPWVRFCKVT
jgi:hypothetical protein